MYFGEGPKAGVIVNHPNLGPVDLRGKTMVNYYLELSGGKFAPSGSIYPKWLQAAHSEGWYGEDSCSGSNNARAQDLVAEVIGLIKETLEASPGRKGRGSPFARLEYLGHNADSGVQCMTKCASNLAGTS